MKTLHRTIKKLTLITGIAMGALILTTTLANADPIKKTEKDTSAAAKEAILEAEVLEHLEAEENFLTEFNMLNAPAVKVFDANDELIYEANVDNIEAIKDKKLLSLIHQSDFLMSYENTSYYKLHN